METSKSVSNEEFSKVLWEVLANGTGSFGKFCIEQPHEPRQIRIKGFAKLVKDDPRYQFLATEMATGKKEGDEDDEGDFVSETMFLNITGAQHMVQFKKERADDLLEKHPRWGDLAGLMAAIKPSHIMSTVFRHWTYSDSGHTLLLDPNEVKQANVAGNSTGVCWGGNRLAIEALPLYPCAGTITGDVTAGFCRNRFYWPLWDQALPLEAVNLLLFRENVVGALKFNKSLEKLGIFCVYQSERSAYVQNKQPMFFFQRNSVEL